MTRKIFYDRKGISEFVLDMFSYLVFIIAIFFFVFLFKFQSATAMQRQIADIKESSSASVTLINYLRTPIAVKIDGENQDLTMGQLISASAVQHKEETERGKLALQKTHEILDGTLGENKWAINVCYPDGRSADQQCWLYLNLNRWSSTIKGHDGNLFGESSTIIPNQEMGKNGIKVTLRVLK